MNKMNAVLNKFTRLGNRTVFRWSGSERSYQVEEEPEIHKHEKSKFFRGVYWAFISVFGINFYYAYLDHKGNTDNSVSRTLMISPLYSSNKWLIEGFQNISNFILKPPLVKMLPDQIPLNPKLLPKTLVINLEGILLSKDFQAGQGVILHLRPGFNKFIEEMSKKYEIVVYSSEDSQFLTEAIQTIDPNMRFFQWCFGREFMVKKDGKQIKDLSLLNRDLRKVVVVDFDSENYNNNNPNLLIVDKYNGEERENNLEYLKLILDQLSGEGVKDVRKEIRKMGGFDAFKDFKEDYKLRQERYKQRRKFFSSNKK